MLSDRQPIAPQLGKMAIPVLLAVSGLHNYLVRKGKRALASLIVDTAEVCEVHHYAMLVGYGASGIHPYGAYETLHYYDMSDHVENYRQACEKGLIKIMSRMGISTIAGYHGAQLFEAVGISPQVTEVYFTGTVSRIGGLSLKQIEQEYFERYEAAYGEKQQDYLDSGGSFQFKAEGEHHLLIPKPSITFKSGAHRRLSVVQGVCSCHESRGFKHTHDTSFTMGVHTFASANSIGGSRACCPNRQTIQSRSNVLWIAK